MKMAAALVPPTALVPATLSAGAYVIRNHQVGLVLHVQVARSTPDNVRLHACPQDENRFPSQQIWWIEPLAHHDAAAEHELVYSITCTGSGKALDGSMDPGTLTNSVPRGGHTDSCDRAEPSPRGVNQTVGASNGC